MMYFNGALFSVKYNSAILNGSRPSSSNLSGVQTQRNISNYGDFHKEKNQSAER